ncbi:MAG: hypothetical protein KAI72_05815, partial [Candidatus Pacebacteria bacterium]|nr:hypothetical protein [Candidatus Paceibacterota bacterium]
SYGIRSGKPDIIKRNNPEAARIMKEKNNARISALFIINSFLYNVIVKNHCILACYLNYIFIEKIIDTIIKMV